MGLAITNEQGTLIEKRQFDAWGQLVKVQDQYGNVLDKMTVLDRGYTGHEHLQSIGIIHMNGRLYDAKLHRFLQPDNFVQSPLSTQSYNRYGYVCNNPLKYTDQSGEWFGLDDLVVASACFVIGYVSSGITTGDWGWKSVKAGLITAATCWLAYNTAGASTGITAGSGSLNVAMGNFIASQVATTAMSYFIPPMGIRVGDWGFSVSPSIAFGNVSGIGASISVTYSDGDFSFSGGIGIMSNSNYNGFGKNSLEVRKSILMNYDDGKTGFSLGTNFWSGDFEQRTSLVGFRNGDFSFSYENDGSPFSYAGKVLSNNTDMYRTAAASIGIGEFSLQTNLFTGKWGGNRKDKNPDFVDLDRGPKGFWKNPEANQYRLGALTIGYKGYRVGTNSEWIRNGFQNYLAHTWISPQPRFDMLSRSWNSYFQYQTPHLIKSTLW